MKNAIAYLRVSTTSQAESGAGLAAQAAAIAAFASKAGLSITATFEDAGISGAAGMADRVGLAAAVAALKRGDVLVVAKRDRLGRDTFTTLGIERAIAKRGACVISADGVGNGDEAADKFMRSVMDAAAAFERDLIKARTKAAMAAMRKAGKLTGEVPFGWTSDDAGNLVSEPAEQLVLSRIIEARAAGLSYRKIAAILTASGTTTKKGSTSWTHTSIVSILKRQAALAA